jgi:hypothetical protein
MTEPNSEGGQLLKVRVDFGRCPGHITKDEPPPLKPIGSDARPSGVDMRQSLTILLAAGLLLAGSLALAGGVNAATIGPTTSCGNSIANTGGLGLICQVTVVNTITVSGGSARVTVRECHGAAGNPQAKCSTRVTNLTRPVTAVTQCNSSINGGGGTLRCSVKVTNEFVGLSFGSTAATVDQCVGSGGGITTGCDPFPATTTGATITQCNGSANGGTLVGLTCTATGTKSAARGVRINQCNGSANGGGALVICSASITNRAGAILPPTDTLAPTEAPAPGPTPIVLIGILLLAVAIGGWSAKVIRTR